MFFEQLANSGSCNRIIAVNCVGRPSQRMWRRQHQNRRLLRLKSAIFLLKCRLRCCSAQLDWDRGGNEWDGYVAKGCRGLWKRPRQPTGVSTEIGGKIGRIRIYYAFNCHSYGVPCCPEPLHPLRRQTLRVRGFLPSSTLLVPIQKSHSPNCQRCCLYLVRFPMLLTQTSNLLSDNVVLLPNWNIRVKCFYDKAKKII